MLAAGQAAKLLMSFLPLKTLQWLHPGILMKSIYLSLAFKAPYDHYAPDLLVFCLLLEHTVVSPYWQFHFSGFQLPVVNCNPEADDPPSDIWSEGQK